MIAALSHKPYRLNAEGIPTASKTRIVAALDKAVGTVEKLFKRPFSHDFSVIVAPNRAEFDRETAKHWSMPPSEPWMVGSGIGDILILLSPDVWNTQATEHNGSDTTELNEIVAHETTHVYHGQICPKHDFDGMDDVGWFIEGLAVWTSGQLASNHRNDAETAIAEAKIPTHLKDSWTGKYRYGVAGSMVDFLDATWGRRELSELMACTSNSQILNRLKLSEPDFLAKWREWEIHSRTSQQPTALSKGEPATRQP